MVAGTGAGVGKTLVTSALVRSLRSIGVEAVAMKAVARGVLLEDGSWHSDEMDRLAAASAFDLPPRALCTHAVSVSAQGNDLGQWLAPTLDAVVDTFRVLSTWADTVVVEDSLTPHPAHAGACAAADLASQLKLPLVLVVGLQRGWMASLRRSVRLLIARRLECAGWIVNLRDANRNEADGAFAILQQEIPGPCLGRLPMLAGNAGAQVAQLIDLERVLAALAHEVAPLPDST
jgi:dethiobiotin synthetase